MLQSKDTEWVSATTPEPMCSGVCAPQLESPHAATTEPVCHN